MSATPPGCTIAEISLAQIETVRDLWVELLRHHGSVSPQMPPIREPDDSWRLRRAEYEEWLAEPGAFVLVAVAEGDPVGYVLVRVGPAEDTWESSERMAEIETLVVTEAWRNQGLGAALMDAAEERLHGQGIVDFSVGVVSTNIDALRFYERRGLTQYWAHYHGRTRPPG